MEDLVTVPGAGATEVALEAAERVVREDLRDVCGRACEELETLAGERVLIAGGAGFLGYYLVRSLATWNASGRASAPVDVIVLDNFARGVPPWLARLNEDGAVTLLEHDVTEPLPGELGPLAYVLHAASIASPIYYRKHPIETMDANVGGLRNLLEAARRQQESGEPLRGILFFSTSEVYGDPDSEHIPTPETYRGNVSCTGPRACYDESKRYGETLCVNFASVHDIPVKMVRPFNNYGPGLRISDRRVVADFARDVLDGEDIVLLSDGSPTRTFCYVADAVVGYLRALVRGEPGEPYNIGADSPEISMADLAELTADLGRELFGYDGRVVRGESDDPEYLVDNPNRRCPDIGKARRALGYEPRVSLEEGLRKSLLWYRGRREGFEQEER